MYAAKMVSMSMFVIFDLSAITYELNCIDSQYTHYGFYLNIGITAKILIIFVFVYNLYVFG